ncbi:hypothetical protein IIA79_06165 [bacterium]|nr:hypothetical protein [bacterium]
MNDIKTKRYYFAVVGLHPDNEEIDIEGDLILRRVQSAPDGHTPVGLVSPQLASAVTMWGRFITHELEVEIAYVDNAEDTAKQLLFFITALIRTKTVAEFVVPLFADTSWTTINTTLGVGWNVFLVENEHSFHVGSSRRKPAKIHREDLAWVKDKFTTLYTIGEVEEDKARLFLTLDCINSYHLERSPNLSALKLYIGLEAIFGASDSGSFAMAAYAASYLELPGPKRKETFNKLIGYSRSRNKIVHAKGQLKEGELRMMLQDLRRLLSASLEEVFRQGKLPEDEDLKRLLLMQKLD